MRMIQILYQSMFVHEIILLPAEKKPVCQNVLHVNNSYIKMLLETILEQMVGVMRYMIAALQSKRRLNMLRGLPRGLYLFRMKVAVSHPK